MDLANILLQITGDPGDARQALAETAADVSAFGDLSAEATADVDVSAAEKSLEEIRADLARFARETAESTARVDTVAANEALDRVEIRLQDLDRESVTADADVAIAGALTKIALLRKALSEIDKGLGPTGELGIGDIVNQRAATVSAIKAITGEVGALDRALTPTNANTKTFTTRLREAWAATGGLGGGIASLIKTALRFGPIAAGFAGALVAIISSLGSAALGAGALAIALGSTLFPAALLAIGAIRRFKDQAKQAGTAAHALQGAAKSLANDFDHALGPAADSVFNGLANVLPTIGKALLSLKPDFTQLGAAVNDFINKLAGFLTANRSIDTLKLSINTLADLVRGPAGDAFISLGKILRNITEAALPLLERAFQSVADALQHVARSTSDISALRQTIRAQVSDLRDWIGLLHQVGRILLGVFRAALPDGRSLVNTMRQGAQALADWVNSAQGQNAIQDFLAKVIPLAQRVVGLFGQVVTIFLKWSDLVAPVIGPILDAVGKVLDVIGKLIDFLNRIPGPAGDAVAAIALIFGPTIIRGILSLGRALAGLALGRLALSFGTLATTVEGAGLAMVGLRSSLLLLGARFGAVGLLAVGMFESFKAGIPVGHDLADSMSSAMLRAEGFTNAIKATTAPLTEFASKQFLASAAGKKAFSELVTSVKSSVNNLVGALKDGGPKAKNAATDLAHGALAAIKAFTGDFRGAGKQLGEALAGGHRSTEGANKNAVTDVTRAAKVAAEAFRVGFSDEGTTHGQRYAGGVEGTRGLASSAGRAIGQAAHDAVTTPDFRGAGAAIGAAVGAGLRAAQGALVAIAQSVGAAVAAAFNAAASQIHGPSGGGSGGGSHPKVSTSSGAAGRALGTDFAAGLAAGITDGLARAVAAAPIQFSGGLAALTPALAGGMNQNFYIPASVAAHGQPDPRHTAAQLALLMRQRGGV